MPLLVAPISNAVMLGTSSCKAASWHMDASSAMTPREKSVLSGIFGVYALIQCLKIDCERTGEDECQAFVLSE